MRGLMRGLGLLLVLVLLTGALLLTLARLLDSGGARWIQLRAFTPYGLLAYALLLVIALGIVARARHRGRRVLGSALALAAVAGLGAHVTWFLPQVTGTTPAAADGAPVLTVMTFNQFGGTADPVGLVEAVGDADVDILVVQEITPQSLELLLDSGLEAAFAHRAGEPIEGVFGTMVFSHQEMSAPTELPTEMATFAVDLAVAGEQIRLVAAHPTPPTRSAQWRSEHRVLGDWALREEPDLIVGDLNATADHVPMRRLAAAGFNSVTDVANESWRPTWPSNRRLWGVLPIPDLVQIDHVICGPTMTALRSRTVEITGSDHRALVAEVAPR